MKKIFIFLACFICLKSFGQFPQKQSLGNPITEVYSKGASGSDSGYVHRTDFADTVALNRGFLKNIPGIQVRTGDSLWRRNQAATKWLLEATFRPCQTIFKEFYVGELGEAGNGDTSVTNANFVGKQVKVYRDEKLQYPDTVSGVRYNSAAGRVRFWPALYTGELVRIQVTCTDTTWNYDISLRLSGTEDSNAIIYSVAIGATGANRLAINNFVKSLKSAGIWDDIHFMSTPIDTSQRFNIKDPRANDSAWYLTYPNGATKSNGVDWNGVDQYATSFYVPTNNYRMHFMVYHAESGSDTGYIGDRPFGANTSQGSQVAYSLVNGRQRMSANDPLFVYTNPSTTSETGFSFTMRSGDTIKYFQANGTYSNRQVMTNADLSPSTRRMFTNAQEFSVGINDTKSRLLSWGNVMDSASVPVYRQIVQAFLSELGIQVGTYANYPTITENPDTYFSRYRWKKGDSLVFNSLDDHWKDGISAGEFNDSLFVWMGWNNLQPNQTTDTFWVAANPLTNFIKQGPTGMQRRHSYGYAKYGGYGYIMLGDAVIADQRDVWRSSDGRNWTQRTSNYGGGQRIIFGACAHGTNASDTALYIAGGQSVPEWSSSATRDDVWKSTDGGANWTQIATGKSFLFGNISSHMVSYGGKIRVISGGRAANLDVDRTFRTYMYSSVDGITWDSAYIPFEAVQYGRARVWDDKLWFVGGHRTMNKKWIWFMTPDGKWHELGSPPFEISATHATSAAVYRDQLVITSGNLTNRCWILSKIPSSE